MPAVLLVLSTAVSGQPPAPPPAFDADEVYHLLGADEFKAAEEVALRAAGGYSPAAFDLYAKVLAGDDTYRASRVLWLLPRIDADRSRFVPAVIGLLAHPAVGIRRPAAEALGAIGSAREAAPLAVLLSAPDPSVQAAAARSLAKLGGDRELAAFDLWLAAHPTDDNAAYVRECRDQLKARLAEAAKGKPAD